MTHVNGTFILFKENCICFSLPLFNQATYLNGKEEKKKGI
jgi:hypothetical protein